MAKLKAMVAKLEEVPEALRELYTERDGKFFLDAEGVEDVSGLKSALEKEREDRRRARAELEKFREVDPERYRELLKQKDEDDRRKLEGKGQWDALEQQLLQKHQQEIKSRDDRLQFLTAAIEKRLVEAEATTAIAGARGIPALLLPHVRQQIKVFEEDGEFVAKVVDSKGNPRIGDSKGSPMSIAQLVEEMKQSEVYGRAFEASGAGGSGAPPKQGGGGNGVIRLSRDAVKQNPAAYAAAKEQAAKAGGTVEFID